MKIRVGIHYSLAFILLLGVGYAQDSPRKQSATQSSAPAAAGKRDHDSDRVIMKVGGTNVTESEFEGTIGDVEMGGDPDKQEEKDRRQLGDDYASVLMLSQIAVANHIDQTPDIRQKLAIARMQILSDAQFAKLLDETKPSEQELSDYYQAHLSEFDTVQIRRLFIWKVGPGSQNTHGLSPEAAKARAAAIMQEASSGGDGLKLAEMFREGEQGIFDPQPSTFVRGQLPEKMNELAFSMKVGQWSEVEDTPNRIVMIYLVGRDRQPLSDVMSIVQKRVQGDKMQAKLDDLKKKTGIWMDPDYFKRGAAVEKDAGEQHPENEPPNKLGN